MKRTRDRYSSDYARWNEVGGSDDEEERSAAQAQREAHIQRHLAAKSGGELVADPAAGGAPPPAGGAQPAAGGVPTMSCNNIADWLMQAQQRQQRQPQQIPAPAADGRQELARYSNDYSRFADIGSDDEGDVVMSGGGLAEPEVLPVYQGTATSQFGTIPGKDADIDAPLTDEEFEMLQAHTREQMGLPQPPRLPPECREDPVPRPQQPQQKPPVVQCAPFVEPQNASSPVHAPGRAPLPRAGQRAVDAARGAPPPVEVIDLNDYGPKPSHADPTPAPETPPAGVAGGEAGGDAAMVEDSEEGVVAVTGEKKGKDEGE
eukprot:Hpha_TRINITY_DN8482_c0_g1::TRINITY_DN8482_c0_g1_i1::g.34814::m.34814